MRNKTIGRLIAVMVILVAVAMSLGCVGSTATIKEIENNPEYAGKEVTVEGILKSDILQAVFGERGFTIREEKCSGYLGLCREIRVEYSGDLPSWSKEGQPYVPGSVTKVKVTGIVRNKDPRVWSPYIEGTSWKYIYRGKTR